MKKFELNETLLEAWKKKLCEIGLISEVSEFSSLVATLRVQVARLNGLHADFLKNQADASQANNKLVYRAKYHEKDQAGRLGTIKEPFDKFITKLRDEREIDLDGFEDLIKDNEAITA